jgi:hypothetical protein
VYISPNAENEVETGALDANAAVGKHIDNTNASNKPITRILFIFFSFLFY